MPDRLTAEGVVLEVIDRVYSDGGVVTPLDRRAARETVAALEAHGWVPASTLAAVVLAAGGEVRVSDQLLMTMGEGKFVSWYDPQNRCQVIRVQRP